MLIEANVQKSGKEWVIDCASFDLMTQGKTKKEAVFMLIDAVKELTEGGLILEEYESKSSVVSFYSNDPSKILSFSIKRLREAQGLSLREVATLAGDKSQTALARYEKYAHNEEAGRKVNNEVFEKYIKAITKDTMEIVLRAV